MTEAREPTILERLMARTASEMETKSGAVPLGEIHRARSTLVARYKVLWARYGQFGTFEAQRKAYRSVIALRLRSGSPPEGVKSWTDKILEEAACADKTYQDYLDNAEKERAELATIEVKLTMLEESYNRGQAELRAYASERFQTGG